VIGSSIGVLGQFFLAPELPTCWIPPARALPHTAQLRGGLGTVSQLAEDAELTGGDARQYALIDVPQAEVACENGSCNLAPKPPKGIPCQGPSSRLLLGLALVGFVQPSNIPRRRGAWDRC